MVSNLWFYYSVLPLCELSEPEGDTRTIGLFVNVLILPSSPGRDRNFPISNIPRGTINNYLHFLSLLSSRLLAFLPFSNPSNLARNRKREFAGQYFEFHRFRIPCHLTLSKKSQKFPPFSPLSMIIFQASSLSFIIYSFFSVLLFLFF